jgi:O-acetyl-ADP-ribose deacetylase
MLNKDKITKENINKIIRYIPYFEDKDNKFYSISKTDIIYPYLYSKEVYSFERSLYDANIVIAFDWGEWQPEAEKIYNNFDLLANADLDTIRKLLTLHIRKERFYSGHLANMIKSGHILNILRRLKEISISMV